MRLPVSVDKAGGLKIGCSVESQTTAYVLNNITRNENPVAATIKSNGYRSVIYVTQKEQKLVDTVV